MPAPASRSVERISVSSITSAVKRPGDASMTVKHTPETAIESPTATSEVTSGPSMVTRTARSLPTAVSTDGHDRAEFLDNPGEHDYSPSVEVGWVGVGLGVAMIRMSSPIRSTASMCSLKADRSVSIPASPSAAGPAPEQCRRQIRNDAVDHAGGDERAGQRRAALEQHADDASIAEGGENQLRVVLRQQHGGRRVVEHFRSPAAPLDVRPLPEAAEVRSRRRAAGRRGAGRQPARCRFRRRSRHCVPAAGGRRGEPLRR